MATATFFVLVKSNVSRQAAGGQAAPAAVAAAEQNIMSSFEAALNNAAAQTGVQVTSKWVAQGAYDYILLADIDSAKWTGPNVQGGPPSPQQIAIGFGAALAQNAAVTTETVPVFPLAQDIQTIVGHSCG